MNLDQLILKTNVEIAQVSSEMLVATLLPALEEWKKQQTSMLNEQSELYDYIMKAPFILNMKNEIECLRKENYELRDKINSLERNPTSSPNSIGSNIVLEITEKDDSNVKFANITSTNIFGSPKQQNDVISDEDDDEEDEDDDDDEEDDDEEDDDEDESPVYKNIANYRSDKKSIKINTYGEDSSVEVYETSIYDALFLDETYYVTNEIDGDIYTIGTNRNVGIKIGKYIDKIPTPI
jgi:hypothetical protein